MSTSMKRLVAACCLLAVGGFFAADFVLLTYRTRSLPKNFQTVRAGVLYRSGQMRPEHFEQVLHDHHIRTVICLNPEPASAFEAGACDRAGSTFVSLRMPGTGVGRPEDFEKVLSIVRDPARQPVLVHCYAGANRTGATVALYRMLEEGWRMEDALREMDVAGFDGSRDLVDHLKELLASFQAKENANAELGREDSDESSSLR